MIAEKKEIMRGEVAWDKIVLSPMFSYTSQLDMMLRTKLGRSQQKKQSKGVVGRLSIKIQLDKIRNIPQET